MIPFRVMHEPKPIGGDAYGCIVMTRSKPARFLVQTLPVDIAPAITKEEVWHHEKGKDLVYAGGGGKLLIKSFAKASPLTPQEKQDYIEFLSRTPKPGELDCKSLLQLTVAGEIQRINKENPNGEDQVQEA